MLEKDDMEGGDGIWKGTKEDRGGGRQAGKARKEVNGSEVLARGSARREREKGRQEKTRARQEAFVLLGKFGVQGYTVTIALGGSYIIQSYFDRSSGR